MSLYTVVLHFSEIDTLELNSLTYDTAYFLRTSKKFVSLNYSGEDVIINLSNVRYITIREEKSVNGNVVNLPKKNSKNKTGDLRYSA